MRIVRVEVAPLPLRLREPYTIAYETVDRVDNVLLRLITDTAHVGLGVAAPDEGVTGERPASVATTLREVAEPLLHGADPLRRSAILEPLADALPGSPSVRAAVDMALHDLLGKAGGIPVWRLLGGYRPSIATSVTLFIEPVEATVQRARAFVGDGFVALKLKGGRSVDDDIARVRAVRQAVGPAVELRFDANQGFSPDEARAFHAGTHDADLALIEQPTPAGRPGALRAVTDAVGLPVMADESLLTLADAFRLARGDVVDMMNLKLVKVGGLDAALLINAVARSAGLEVMVGCMDEAALSIASGLAFALSRRNVEFADLDGHLDLLDDPTTAAVHLRDGHLFPAEGPGFGLVDVAG
jgi:L-alanine-DL-glutamate epimerase-like enolase superfamily enzyme